MRDRPAKEDRLQKRKWIQPKVRRLRAGSAESATNNNFDFGQTDS